MGRAKRKVLNGITKEDLPEVFCPACCEVTPIRFVTPLGAFTQYSSIHLIRCTHCKAVVRMEIKTGFFRDDQTK